MSQDHVEFPPKTELLPERELISESFGWQPGTWGAFLVVAAAWGMTGKDPLSVRLSCAAGATALGAWMLFYEFRRRAQRTAISLRGGKIGIYRKGELSLTVAPNQIMHFQTSYLNTVRFVLAPLFFGVLGLIPILELTSPHNTQKPPIADLLAGLCLAAAGLASAASMIWTRHVWVTFRLPRASGSMEDFNLTRADAKPLTGR